MVTSTHSLTSTGLVETIDDRGPNLSPLVYIIAVCSGHGYAPSFLKVHNFLNDLPAGIVRFSAKFSFMNLAL